jgi:hypothetical protein
MDARALVPAAEIAAGIVVASLIAGTATQLVRSVRAADDHVATGIGFALTASAVDLGNVLRIAQPAGRAATAVAPAAPVASDDDSAPTLLFKLLNAYYAANISQGGVIFWASLLSMSIGFAIIIGGVIAAASSGITGIIAAIAGILSQFVAATFLVALRSTQDQATSYAQGLVALRERDVARLADERAVELGLQLLREISADANNPVNPTKAAIALGLIVKQPASVVEQAPVIEVPAKPAPASERTRAASVTFDDTPAADRR